MTKGLFRKTGVVLLMFSLFAVGCGEDGLFTKTELPRTTEVDLSELSPTDASKNINLVRGTVITMEQAFVGFGSDIDFNKYSGDQVATRTIIIDRFAPHNVANISWDYSRETELDGDKATETLKANLDGMNLKDTPQMLLPAFWPAAEHSPSWGTSAIWVSLDRFEGLSRNQIGTLNASFLDKSVHGELRDNAYLRTLLDRLEAAVKSVDNSTDVYLANVEIEPMTLMVNEEELEVEVLKATTWFGDYVILNNSQNPIVLKFSFNDKNEDGSLRFTGAGNMKKWLDFEVTSLRDVAH